MDRETYSLQLIPKLERRLGIHPSQPEWAQVETVADLLVLVRAHASRGEFVVDMPQPAA